ncbi:DUF6493 family protein [Streptosporangium carneum]|uniref:Secreted protein n=1 Tax=Streptosporangium carneum TaxID=47481 RepID=A0A9W6I9Z6_9ACTN|nr:DUF6493 family protein [Streptosporangium carneum]GLK14836.1 hypothetical protein GCM10017600_82480 [Streptosporangium carneum]
MNVWKAVGERVRAGDVDGTLALVTALDADDRKALAAELPRYVAERSRRTNSWEWSNELSPLLMAGAACLSGSAAVTSWLFRREFRWRRVDRRETELLLRILRTRPETWQAETARRMAGRLRPSDLRHWPIVATLVRELGVEPPDGDAFMVGWLRTVQEHAVDRVADDPLLPRLAPRIFQTDSLGEVLLSSQIEAIACLVDRGALDRAAVVDGVVGRLLGDGPSALPALAWLHDRLRLDLDESAERAKDYVRLLPVAPLPVAEMALTQLREVEAAGRLEGDLFEEAAEALAFRPEKKLLRAAVAWIGDVVRRTPGHTDTGLRALSVVFGQETLAAQERAVRLAVKLAGQAGESGRAAIRDAAAGLPVELREQVSTAYGEVVAVSPPAPPVLVVGVAPAAPPPVASPGELAHELVAVDWRVRPEQFERILAGLVEWAHREPDALRAELRPWWHPFSPGSFGYHDYVSDERMDDLLRRAALAFASPEDSRALSELFASARRRNRHGEQAPFDRVVQRRAHEVIERLEAGDVLPVLLATPTSGTGHLDPEVLLERLQQVEAAGARVPPADFQQALLRLPRSVDPAAAARAASLTSDAGRTLAAWLNGGGLPDPVVTCGIERQRSRWYGAWARGPRATVRPATPDLPELVRELCAQDLERDSGLSFQLDWWPLVMPSHRDVVAAHLLETLPVLIEDSDGQVAALARLAQGDGPVGAATAYALACGMGHRDPAERASATEALLTLAARGQVPAADLGRAVTELVREDIVKLNRVTAVLDDAARAGAHAAVWAVIAGTLPGLLPAQGDRPRAGLADLLAAGARAAELAGARADIPELAAVAARGGSSRVVQEARRLRRLVASAEAAT